TAAGRVRNRAAAIHVATAVGAASLTAASTRGPPPGESRNAAWPSLLSRSRVALEPREVGLALLEVGFLAFAAFVGRVVHERRRAGERHHAGLAVAVGVHR